MSKVREFSLALAALFVLIMVTNIIVILEIQEVNLTDLMMQPQNGYNEVKNRIVHKILFGHNNTMQEKPNATKEIDKISGEKCLDILEIGKVPENTTKLNTQLLNLLKKIKHKKRFLRDDYYLYLSGQVASMVNFTATGKGINGTNVTIANEWRLRQMRGQLPYLSCPLHEFRTSDLKDCVAARERNGLTSHIAFVGDSRIRYLLELFLYEYRDLDLLITTFKGETVTPELFMGETGQTHWIKYKHHFFVKTAKLKDLKFEFFWAPVLHENRNPDERRLAGAWDLLEEWANSNETLPDMIVLDSGPWGLIISKQEPLDTLISHGVEAMKKLAPVLAQLATRTTVIFQLPDPILEFVHHQFTQSSYEQQTNAMMNWLLTAYANLQPPNVIVWDSFVPVAYQQREDCMKLVYYLKNLNTLPSYPSIPQKITWQCYERMHTGFEGLTIGLQMLINHICNPFVDRLDVCCSKRI